MNNKILLTFCALLFLLLRSSNLFAQTDVPIDKGPKGDLNIPIDKGIIKGDFSIAIPDLNITLKPNEYFTLSTLRIIANTRRSWRVEDIFQLGSKSWNGYTYYKVKIVRQDNTTYYGILMFYNTNKRHKEDGVSQYYEISIPNSSFNGAINGKIQSRFEFWRAAGFGDPTGGLMQFTWVLWFSDTEQAFNK